MTNPSKRNRGVTATEEGVKRLKQAKSQLRQTNGRPITNADLAAKAQVSLDTVKRFLKDGHADEDYAIAICNALELDYCEIVDCSKGAKPKQQPQHGTATGSLSPWPQVCRSMLDRHRRLTTNEWLTDPSSHFNVDDIHIPLSLLERQTKAIRSSNSPAAKGDSAHEVSEVSEVCEVCEVQQFTHDAFLDRILREGEGKTQGKRIAIIGEPGAGKTTLLQKIASWILDHELGLPIWISLADLQLHNNRLENLGEYLKNVWLKRAVAFDTPATQAEFSQLVQTGQVWLLLDGLDEISLPFMSALREVRDLLEGWISASRVIVTCRVNVWEASLNALDQFETYRIGQFSPEQIENFIKNWFAQSRPDQGHDLWQALNDSRNHRIQDLVKSPLQLTLLCSTWQEDSTLPDTKAALYERFIAALYRWKSDRFSISRSEREKLDKSLGELAKAAIDRGGSAYRLTQVQVDEHLDDQTRNLCLALGWLNSLGDRNQEVYAFIHPTFQEYFAALSIEDGDFFFDPDAEEAHQRSYRVFDARWKEPLLTQIQI